MPIRSMTGHVSVYVDEVAVEQIRLEQPRRVKSMPPALQATVAAFYQEDVRALDRQCHKCHHILKQLSAVPEGKGWLVTLEIRAAGAQDA